MKSEIEINEQLEKEVEELETKIEIRDEKIFALETDLEAAQSRIKELEQRQSFAAGNVGLHQIESLEKEITILNRMVELMAEWSPCTIEHYRAEAEKEQGK